MRWFRRRRDLSAGRSAPLAEAVEARLLFSADITGGLALAASADVVVEQRTLTAAGEYAQAPIEAAVPLALDPSDPTGDAFTVSVPGPQATPKDTELVFPDGQVAVSDVEGGNGTVQVTIIVTHGTVSLGGTLVSAGGEFRVNTTTAGVQSFDADSRQAVAMDEAGNFVVVWQSDDGSGTGIYAQRFNAAGVAQGAEFRVNTTTGADQGRAVVAMDAAGNFVVAWESDGQDGTSWGVYARRYDAAGNALGGEFQVTSSGAANERYPSIAMNATGQFVIAWQAGDPSGAVSSFDVHARRFDAAGNALGAAFRVNTTTADGQLRPAVAMDAAGNFVVVWQSHGQDGNGNSNGYAVVGQRYDAAGNALGGEFIVNTTFTGDQWHAAVAMNATGSFVVVWEGEGAGDGNGIFGRRYDASGNALGAEFHVNATHQRPQLAPSVGMDDAGGFTVSWNTKLLDDGNSEGVFIQRYAADGSAMGGETLVNTTTPGDQEKASLSMTGGGDFVVVWSGNGAGDASGIFGQRYDRLPGLAFSAGDGIADTDMVFTGTVADVNSALAGMRFRPENGYVGLGTVQITADSPGSAGGDPQSGSGTITVTVGPVTDAPVLALVRLDVTEGGTVVLGSGNIVIADPDSSSFTYNVSGLAGGRFQVYDGAAWNDADGFTSAQLAAGQVRFVDDGDEVAPSFSMTASDGSSSSNTRAANITFTRVNDAPSLGGAQLAVAEGGTVLLSAANFAVTDPDSSVFTYTVSSVAGGVFQTFDGTAWNTATSFTTAQLAAGRVRFVDDGDEVPPSFSVTVSDGALASGPVAATITFTPVNDAPVLAAATLAVTEGGTVVLGPANFTVSDPDSASFTYTVSALAGGVFQVFDGTTWNVATSFTSAQVAAGQVRFVDDGDEVAPSFDLGVDDGTGAGNTVAAGITFVPVNDAPVLTSASLAVAEGGTAVLGAGNVVVVDADSTAFTFEAVGVTGGVFQVFDGMRWNDASGFSSAQLAAGAVRFVHDGGEAAPTFTLRVSDGSTAGNALAGTVAFTPVNDAPAITGPATVKVVENTAAVATLTAEDPDTPAERLTWSLVGGDDAGLFTIDPRTGALSFRSSPDFEVPADRNADNVYQVIVQVSDGSLAATWTLRVAVVDADDSVAPPAPPPPAQPPVSSSAPAAAPAPAAPAPAAAPVHPGPAPRPAGSASPGPSAAFVPAADGQLVTPNPLPSFGPASLAVMGAVPESNRLLHLVAFEPRGGDLIAAQAQADPALARFGIDARGDGARIEELQRSLRSGTVAVELDRLREDTREEVALERSFTVSVAGVSLGLSVLYVLWLVRGGVLLGSYLSALPAWRMLDPLPVLSRVEDGPEEDEEGIAELEGDGRDTLRGFGGPA